MTLSKTTSVTLAPTTSKTVTTGLQSSAVSIEPTRLPSPVIAPAKISDLKDAIGNLSVAGLADVQIVRDSFSAGIAPVQTASTGSVANFVDRFAASSTPATALLGPLSSSAREIVRSTAQLGVSTAVIGTISTPPRPELDFVEIATDRSFGVLDSFYTRIVASLAIADVKKVTYIRILRASHGPIDVAKPSFSAMMDSTPLGFKTNSTEGGSNAAFRVDSVGVGNKLTDFIVDDPFSTSRAVVSSGSMISPPAVTNTNKGQTSSGLISIPGADRAVLENVSFYINQRTQTKSVTLADPLVVAQRYGINVLAGSAIANSVPVVEERNAPGFSEVGRIPVATGRLVGGFLEVEYFDPAVVYGGSYSYYVTAVTADGRESLRSRLVKVNVMRAMPPVSPEVLYGVVGGRPQFSMRCAGSFIDHVEVFRKGGAMPARVTALSTGRAMFDGSAPIKLDSGFYHLGDIGVGQDKSAAFVDRDTAGGQHLEYRFYTVDSFGFKSATPFSCSISLPDDGATVALDLPSITAEQGPGGRVVNVSVMSDDLRTNMFVVGRRELRTGESSYRQPTEPDRFTLGRTDAKRARSRTSPSLHQDSSVAWLGTYSAVSGAASFVDLSVEYDRIYQYAVYAVDIRGNKTSKVPSQQVFVAAKPVSDSPVAVTCSLVIDRNETPTGVRVSWDVGTLDFSPNDLVGDQDVLAATLQRTVFQVERRQVGTSNWEAMPATTGSEFVDIVSTDPSPKFRPAYVLPNFEYDYRVIAMQSGAFISTYTNPVRVVVAPGIPTPTTLWVRSTPTAVRPISVVVSWQYDGIFVDGWEIERAATNKVFGSKIFSMDSTEARSLAYKPIAEVMRESSRGHGLLSDPTVSMDPSVTVGDRFFMDNDVDLANSYYYRIRAFDSSGRFSDWTYGGIMLTDSPHDRKFYSSLSEHERVALTSDPRPISKWRAR